jgi:hypothetical protein
LKLDWTEIAIGANCHLVDGDCQFTEHLALTLIARWAACLDGVTRGSIGATGHEPIHEEVDDRHLACFLSAASDIQRPSTRNSLFGALPVL